MGRANFLKGQGRTDKILILLALLILLITGGAFYFDSWMWGAQRVRGERIGTLVMRSGDVRLKFQDDLRWQKASAGQDLAYNDAIFSGVGSQAELRLGESQMQVNENSLIILRRDQDVSFLNLKYGTLFGEVAAHDKIVIETGEGKPIELSSSQNTKIVLRKQNGKTRLDVTSGEATVKIDGKVTKVDSTTKIEIDEESKVTRAIVKNELRLIKPLSSQVLTSEEPTQIAFEWGWTQIRQPAADEHYRLEFSRSADFGHLHAIKDVRGQLRTSLSVSQTLRLYYRVRGPGGEVSPIEQVAFIRLEKPVIMRPLTAQKFEANDQGRALVTFEFQKPKAANLEYELSLQDPAHPLTETKKISANQERQELTVGTYSLRARSDFGAGHLSAWSEPVNFEITPLRRVTPMVNMHMASRVLIPNRRYPRSLYVAPSQIVQNYLASVGTLENHFPYRASDIRELKIQMKSGEVYTQNTVTWPSAKLKPGHYRYRYQVTKDGFEPSAWSDAKDLEIAMEPPLPLGEASYGEADSKGQRTAKWKFTPLLFARSYDIEVASDPTFVDALEFKTAEAMAETDLPQGEYFWRVRARDRSGRLISAFSKSYRLKPMPAPAPILAQAPAQERKPAAKGNSVMKQEVQRQLDWARNGWWAWLGSGYNYVDYRQSLPGVGSLTSFNAKVGSQYAEGGFLNKKGLGGVLSYKNTPGQMSVDNAPVRPSTYNWTTLALEGMLRKRSPYAIWNSPIYYGLRAGVQRHYIPFLSLSSDQTYIDLKSNEMTAGSFGVLAEWMRSRWSYYWSMRYQIPFSEKAQGANSFTMTPVFSFDGSLGTAYNFTSRMKLGLFWYGQWHQMNFDYSSSTVTNSGFQSLFYSNIDLRLGFDF